MSSSWFTWLAVAALALIAYAYFGYALIVRLFVRPRAISGAAGDGAPPRLSVLVAARNEARSIERRVRNLLEQDYPAGRLEVLVVSDASDDGTDRLVEGLADPRVRVVRQAQRAGKTAGINLIAPLAQGDILVQTDANVLFAPGALAALARAFRDPSVGVALGEVTFTNADEPVVAGGEGLYWRLETWVKRVEAERGLLVVANGGIYALRRALWRPLPPTIAGDAAEPLLAAHAGLHTVVAPGAVAFERAAATLREEFARKARIIAQQVACARWLGLWRLPPRIAWAYVSHKLLRYLVPVLALLAGLAGAAAAGRGSRCGAALAALTLLPLVLAPLGLIRWPGAVGRVLQAPLYLVVVNAAALVGLWRGLSGQAQAAWETPASTRGPEAGGARGAPPVG